MSNEEQDLEQRRRELDAEIAANDKADRLAKQRQKRIILTVGAIIFLAIAAYLIFRPEYVPDVYYDAGGRIDYVRQAEKIRGEGKYKDVYEFSHGYATVSDGKKFGLIDVKGNLVVPIQYDEVNTFSNPYPDRALVRKDSLYGLCDKSGKEVLPCEYSEIGTPSSGVMLVKKGKEQMYVDLNGKKVNM